MSIRNGSGRDSNFTLFCGKGLVKVMKLSRSVDRSEVKRTRGPRSTGGRWKCGVKQFLKKKGSYPECVYDKKPPVSVRDGRNCYGISIVLYRVVTSQRFLSRPCRLKSFRFGNSKIVKTLPKDILLCFGGHLT